MRMGRTVIQAVLVSALLLLFIGCQDIFTQSAFTWAAQDPADMSGDQLEAYAEDVVKSGDTDAMAETFDALEPTLPAAAEDDPELYLLASDLAMGGSGLSEALSEVFQAGEDTELVFEDVLNDVISGLDAVYLQDSIDIFADVATAAGGDPSIEIEDSQYVNAAIAQAILIYEDIGAYGTPDPADPRVIQAEAWAAAGGLVLDDIYLGL